MKQNIPLTNSSAQSSEVVRSLREGPDYEPDWRWRIAEKYVVAIEKSDPKKTLETILIGESDPFIRQLLLFQSGRRCIIREALNYAISCRRSNGGRSMAPMLKTLIIAGKSADEIARELGTASLNIITFEKLFFDVRRYLALRIWLKQICEPGSDEPRNQQEARWLAIAYTGGWPALQSVLFSQSPERLDNPGAELSRLLEISSIRARDYILGLEAAGVAPNKQDIQLLLALSRSPLLKRPPAPAGSINGSAAPVPKGGESAAEPIESEEQKSSSESVAKLSLESRKKIIAVLQRFDEVVKQDPTLWDAIRQTE